MVTRRRKSDLDTFTLSFLRIKLTHVRNLQLISSVPNREKNANSKHDRHPQLKTMPPSRPSSSPSSSSKSPPSPPPLCFPLQSPHFTPIQECRREEEEEEEDADSIEGPTSHARKKPTTPEHHQPTPLHHAPRSGKPASKKRQESSGGDDISVSCNNCRPHGREKISVVPLDNGSHHHGLGRHSIPSPNGIFKSILSTLTKRSPRSIDAASSAVYSVREEQWKIALAELSHKLIQTTRKRDEAILEASRLKYSMAELEKKLNKLELYCHSLKSGLDECNNSPYRTLRNTRHINPIPTSSDKVIEPFLVAVSEARSSVRSLSRSLAMQLRGTGGKLHERVSLLLQPHDVKVASPSSRSPRSLLLHLEALLNRAFFEDFESVGFQKSAANTILNPVDRCEANLTSFNVLCKLTWDEVLNKGTRHFSQEFSRFCDRKMSEIVAMLRWTRAWPEPLLQAFFGASKGVWLVHLLANSVHPGLPIYRLDKGARFDPVYMDDMGTDNARGRLVPTAVRIMVAPGFYVYGNVVKCKVLCRYYSSSSANGMLIDDKDTASATSP